MIQPPTDSSPVENRLPAAPSLRRFYLIAAVSTGMGVAVTILLNAFTPLEFISAQLDFWRNAAPREFVSRFLYYQAAILGICSIPVLVMRGFLAPVRRLFSSSEGGGAQLLQSAQRRALNLPFLFAPTNLAFWLLLPGGIAFARYNLMADIDLRTAIFIPTRAAMVGLVSSVTAYFWLEHQVRVTLAPALFAEGRISKVVGVARLSISKRVRALFRIAVLVPAGILFSTLWAFQWEIDPNGLSPRDYGRIVIRFALVLYTLVLFFGGIISRMVARSITYPVEEMLRVVEKVRGGDYSARIQVVSNDEVGVLGEAGNEMIGGLAKREALREAFGRYVTPQIRDEILSGRIPLDGEVKAVTLLFSDLRDFTPLVESLPPKPVVRIINGYFAAMAEAIAQEGGLVLQFIGDEIEAVFGAPVPLENHFVHAARAALAMRDRLGEYNRDLGSKGYRPLRHGVGIETGSVLAANIGSPARLSYAMVGETVNQASRIQGLTRPLGRDIILGAEAAGRLGPDFDLEELPTQRLRGVSRKVRVYALK